VEILASLRQLRFPPELRIRPRPWPGEAWALVAASGRAARGLAEAAGPVTAAEGASAAPGLAFLADVATGLWRLRQRMLAPGSERPREEMRGAFRHLESTWDALREAGVEILDHTGVVYDSGMALEVLAFQPTPGTTREHVLETIKPTVYVGDRRLQMGQVIVASPPAAGELRQEESRP
jgi:hypothetical protein